MRVRIPSPLRSYVGGASVVEASGDTVDAVLRDLDTRHPGIRFRVVDEQGRLRQHMKVFVNADMARELDEHVGPDDEVSLIQALSGGLA